jgi:hypothetical protein
MCCVQSWHIPALPTPGPCVVYSPGTYLLYQLLFHVFCTVLTRTCSTNSWSMCNIQSWHVPALPTPGPCVAYSPSTYLLYQLLVHVFCTVLARTCSTNSWSMCSVQSWQVPASTRPPQGRQVRAVGWLPPSLGSEHRRHEQRKCFVCLNTACLNFEKNICFQKKLSATELFRISFWSVKITLNNLSPKSWNVEKHSS